MFGFTWLTLRQAEQALRAGRLEEAASLLEQPAVRNHRRGGDLTLALAHAYIERGERALKREEVEAAWSALLQAEQLGLSDRHRDRLRQSLVQLSLAELRAQLQGGDLGRAEELVIRLRQRQIHTAELGLLDEGLRLWRLARDQANQGEFTLAQQHAEQAGRLLGINAHLQAFEADLRLHQHRFPEMLVRLHEAAAAQRWQDVVQKAEQILAIAPGHAETRALRSRAWGALQPETVAAPSPGLLTEPVEDDSRSPRYLLWIDGVGGYLVCPGIRITFGQALLDARVDVPLVADVSRLHATLTRDAEGYLLEAVRPIQINGVTAMQALLQSGNRVTLGASCQFQFRLPVPGNMTARLDLVSGHRLPTSVDGVLLLAETILLTPQGQGHVLVPELKHSLVLFRHREGLGVRYPAGFRLNGQAQIGRVMLPRHATIVTEEITLAIEPA